MTYAWDFSFILANSGLLVHGLKNTVKLAAVCFAAGMSIGLVGGVFRTAPIRALRILAISYVELFRNIPALILLVWFYYAIPAATGWQLSVWTAATVSLSLYSGAYSAEIYRAGIESIDRGQWEAAKALGFGYVNQLHSIILPQAIPRMIPAFTNRAIEMLKATTLASTLSYHELLYQAKMLGESEYRPLEAYTTVAVLFMIIILPLSYISFQLERKTKVNSKDDR